VFLSRRLTAHCRAAQKEGLASAVDTCIDAATHELQPDDQQRLLRAAAFGKTFLELYAPDRFVDACRTLRVLNAVRAHTVGIPLTYPQCVSSRLVSFFLVRCCYLPL
jgi:hypothetical protein